MPFFNNPFLHFLLPLSRPLPLITLFLRRALPAAGSASFNYPFLNPALITARRPSLNLCSGECARLSLIFFPLGSPGVDDFPASGGVAAYLPRAYILLF